ncbi:MAG: tyrosine-type recombinase/integrase [Acidobacteria bacterium]|nr:tyrosine-type recombinase/integrase [Acidobacteriota bacterium]
MSETALVRVEAPSPGEELTRLVLNGVTSGHTKRSYRTGLEQFFAWLESKPRQPFSKALVGEYRAHLLQLKLSASTLNLRLSPLRKLAREMADNGLLDPGVASAIECIKGVTQEGVRTGNWLLKEEANELLNAPDPSTLKGKRDRAILALLVSCGLRRAELVSLEVDRIQQREGRWVIPDLVGKGNRRRTVTVPAAVKVRIDAWLAAAKIAEGRVFRPVNKGDRVTGEFIGDEKAIWQLVVHYARATSLGKLAPHDLRRSCAKLCRKAGGELEQIQLLLGHASIRTTERYLGTEQNLSVAVNDGLGLEMD